MEMRLDGLTDELQAQLLQHYKLIVLD